MGLFPAACRSGEQNANGRSGEHRIIVPAHGMELLSDSCSSLPEVHVELPHVLLQEPDGDILGAQVARVLRSRDLLDGEQSARLLLL